MMTTGLPLRYHTNVGVLASAKPEVRSGAYRRDDGVLVIPVSLLGA